MKKLNHILKVFISYAREDKVAADNLCQRLISAGVDVWLDKQSILPGQDWEHEIRKAVQNADAILICLSKEFNKAGYRQREVRIALDQASLQPEGEIFIIPIRTELCESLESLRRWQWVDLFESNGFELLMRALQTRAKSIDAVVPDFEQQKTASNQSVNSSSPLILGGIEYCYIPQGKFLMGTNQSYRLLLFPFFDLASDEKPQHIVDISYTYWIARFPVTNQQFNDYIVATGKIHPVQDWNKKKDHPVIRVSWDDATDYCHYLNNILKFDLPNGYEIRLPTEAEWEKAARGTDGRIYPWGNTYDKNKLNTLRGADKATTSVGAYSPMGDSPYGCADILGNVEQWTHSLLKPYPYKVFDGRENEEEREHRVRRGGYFSEISIDRPARCTDRHDYSGYDQRFGFRVAVAPSILKII